MNIKMDSKCKYRDDSLLCVNFNSDLRQSLVGYQNRIQLLENESHTRDC